MGGFPVGAFSTHGLGLSLERGKQAHQRGRRAQHGCFTGLDVFESHSDPVGLDPMERPFAQGRAGGDLQSVKETGLRRLGERAFATHLDIEVAPCLHRTESLHPDPRPGDH